MADYKGLKEIYPFSWLFIPPTVKPQIASIKVIAANQDLVTNIGGIEDDFKGEYSRELHMIIPIDYRRNGCKVYGAKWFDSSKFNDEDIHFNGYPKMNKYGYEFCVGTPESFQLLENVILENVRTAEMMLIAYERVMTGDIDELDLIAYSHGYMGRLQYRKECKKEGKKNGKNKET